MNTQAIYTQSGLTPRKLHFFELEEFAINLRLEWQRQEDIRTIDKGLGDFFFNLVRNSLITDTPRDDTLLPEERRLPIDELDKYARINRVTEKMSEIEDRYFSIFQPNASKLIPSYDYEKDYLVGELVRFSPKPNPEEWKKIVNPDSIQWENRVTKKIGKPQIYVKPNPNTDLEISLYGNPNVYWMCISDVEGISSNPNTDYKVIKKLAHANGIVPKLDYTWTDKRWFDSPQDYIQEVSGHYPGSKHWVYIGVRGTGEYDSDEDILRIAHNQVWYARAKILSTIIETYKDLPRKMTVYHRKGPFAKDNYHKDITEDQKDAYDILSRYINDFDELGAFTVERQLEADARDVDGYTDEKYQFFYQKDFQFRTEVDGEIKWLEYDSWGPAYYIHSEGEKKAIDKAFVHMEQIFSDQNSSDHQMFIRKSKPMTEEEYPQNIPSPQSHWNKRQVLWNKVRDHFHSPVEEFYRLSWCLHPPTNEELLQKYGMERGVFLNKLRQAVQINQGQSYVKVQSDKWSDKNVIDVRNWVKRAIDFFKGQENFENKEVSSTILQPGDTFSQMRRVIQRIRPKNKTLNYLIRSFYNGEYKNDKSTFKTSSKDYVDWNAHLRILWFKTCMLYGLCIKRRWLNKINDMENMYRNWRTLWFQPKAQEIPLYAFAMIWPDGPDQITKVNDYEWIYRVLIEPSPSNWVDFKEHPIEWEIEVEGNQRIVTVDASNPEVLTNLHVNYTKLRLNNVVASDTWRTIQEYWIYFLSRYNLPFGQNSTVLSIASDVRKKHIQFIKGYLPEYRIYKHPKYGSMAFARLLPPEPGKGYKKNILHVSAFAVKQNYDGENLVIDNSRKQDFIEFQWFVPGFGPEDNINNWLSGTRNQITQTLNRAPLMGMGREMLTEEQKKHIKNIYREQGTAIKQKMKDNVKKWQKIREQEKALSDELKRAQNSEATLSDKVQQIENKQKSLRALLEDKEKQLRDLEKTIAKDSEQGGQ